MKIYICQTERWPEYYLDNQNDSCFAKEIDLPEEFINKFKDIDEKWRSLQVELQKLYEE